MILRQLPERNTTIIQQFLLTQKVVDRDCKVVDLQKTRKRYVVIESLGFTSNIFWLASCFFKIKKPNSHFLGNQSGIAGFPIFILKKYSDLNFNLWICAVQEKYTKQKDIE